MSSRARKFRRAEARRRAKELVRAGKDAHSEALAELEEQDGAQEIISEFDAPPHELVGLGEGQQLPRLLRTSDVAGMFRVHGKTVERWRRLDGLPCLRIRGTVRYDLSDVLRWASARKEGV